MPETTDSPDEWDNQARREFALRWDLNPDSAQLKAALTHTSAAATVAQSGERLEFLGDALLSAFVARYLIDALPPDAGEDTLSRARVQVVRKETLAAAGRTLGLSRMIAVGPGERKEGRHRHDSLLADTYEALIATIALERGVAAMEAFLRETLNSPLAEVTAAPPAPDPKTLLQMRLQSTGRGLPVYDTVEATGRGHDHHFIVVVRDTEGVSLGKGEGPNKRAAQMEAARRALESA